VLDLDALNASEKANFVWHAPAACRRPTAAACSRCSRGGSDSDQTREFDLVDKAFVKDGFFRPDAKGQLSWRDADSVYVGTDFGPGSMTTSGYARIVKLWQRARRCPPRSPSRGEREGPRRLGLPRLRSRASSAISSSAPFALLQETSGSSSARTASRSASTCPTARRRACTANG
jgi:hypothetical protein